MFIKCVRLPYFGRSHQSINYCRLSKASHYISSKGSKVIQYFERSILLYYHLWAIAANSFMLWAITPKTYLSINQLLYRRYAYFWAIAPKALPVGSEIVLCNDRLTNFLFIFVMGRTLAFKKKIDTHTLVILYSMSRV